MPRQLEINPAKGEAELQQSLQSFLDEAPDENEEVKVIIIVTIKNNDETSSDFLTVVFDATPVVSSLLFTILYPDNWGTAEDLERERIVYQAASTYKTLIGLSASWMGTFDGSLAQCLAGNHCLKYLSLTLRFADLPVVSSILQVRKNSMEALRLDSDEQEEPNGYEQHFADLFQAINACPHLIILQMGTDHNPLSAGVARSFGTLIEEATSLKCLHFTAKGFHGLEALARPLKVNKSLQELCFRVRGHLPQEERQKQLQPIWESIKESIKDNYTLGTLKPRPDPPQALLDFYLKLNRLGRGHLLAPADNQKPSHEDWVNAIVAGKDDLAAVDYFLRQNPLVCKPAVDAHYAKKAPADAKKAGAHDVSILEGN